MLIWRALYYPRLCCCNKIPGRVQGSHDREVQAKRRLGVLVPSHPEPGRSEPLLLLSSFSLFDTVPDPSPGNSLSKVFKSQLTLSRQSSTAMPRGQRLDPILLKTEVNCRTTLLLRDLGWCEFRMGQWWENMHKNCWFLGILKPSLP